MLELEFKFTFEGQSGRPSTAEIKRLAEGLSFVSQAFDRVKLSGTISGYIDSASASAVAQSGRRMLEKSPWNDATMPHFNTSISISETGKLDLGCNEPSPVFCTLDWLVGNNRDKSYALDHEKLPCLRTYLSPQPAAIRDGKDILYVVMEKLIDVSRHVEELAQHTNDLTSVTKIWEVLASLAMLCAKTETYTSHHATSLKIRPSSPISSDQHKHTSFRKSAEESGLPGRESFQVEVSEVRKEHPQEILKPRRDGITKHAKKTYTEKQKSEQKACRKLGSCTNCVASKRKVVISSISCLRILCDHR